MMVHRWEGAGPDSFNKRGIELEGLLMDNRCMSGMKIRNKNHKLAFAFVHHKICTSCCHTPVSIHLSSKSIHFHMKGSNCYLCRLNIDFGKASICLSGGSILKDIEGNIETARDGKIKKEGKMYIWDTET